MGHHNGRCAFVSVPVRVRRMARQPAEPVPAQAEVAAAAAEGAAQEAAEAQAAAADAAAVADEGPAPMEAE